MGVTDYAVVETSVFEGLNGVLQHRFGVTTEGTVVLVPLVGGALWMALGFTGEDEVLVDVNILSRVGLHLYNRHPCMENTEWLYVLMFSTLHVHCTCIGGGCTPCLPDI